MKANYGPVGGGISLRWEAGRFINVDLVEGTAEGNSSLAMQAERVFLHLVRWHSAKGIKISPSRSSSDATVLFARHPQSEGVSKGRFEQAMNVLLEQDKIEPTTLGHPQSAASRSSFPLRKTPDDLPTVLPTGLPQRFPTGTDLAIPAFQRVYVPTHI